MIPPLNDDGNLPPGIWPATLEEVEARFTSYGVREHRVALFEGFKAACELLQVAGCQRVYLDGSFVTRKWRPGDVDVCWDREGVDRAILGEVLWDWSRHRREVRERFCGDYFPSDAEIGGLAFRAIDFLQVCKRTRRAKGILVVWLQNEGSDESQNLQR